MNIKIAVLAVIVVLAGCKEVTSDEVMIFECTNFTETRIERFELDFVVKNVFVIGENIAYVSYGYEGGASKSIYCGVSPESNTVFTSSELSEVQEYLAIK